MRHLLGDGRGVRRCPESDVLESFFAGLDPAVAEAERAAHLMKRAKEQFDEALPELARSRESVGAQIEDLIGRSEALQRQTAEARDAGQLALATTLQEAETEIQQRLAGLSEWRADLEQQEATLRAVVSRRTARLSRAIMTTMKDSRPRPPLSLRADDTLNELHAEMTELVQENQRLKDLLSRHGIEDRAI